MAARRTRTSPTSAEKSREREAIEIARQTGSIREAETAVQFPVLNGRAAT